MGTADQEYCALPDCNLKIEFECPTYKCGANTNFSLFKEGVQTPLVTLSGLNFISSNKDKFVTQGSVDTFTVMLKNVTIADSGSYICGPGARDREFKRYNVTVEGACSIYLLCVHKRL